MPIRPENKHLYPPNWKTEIRPAILKRAKNRCENCGVENHTFRLNPKTGKTVRIVLTIAHVDQNPANCDPSNLKAWCQKCHNSYDAPFRAANRRRRKERQLHEDTSYYQDPDEDNYDFE